MLQGSRSSTTVKFSLDLAVEDLLLNHLHAFPLAKLLLRRRCQT